MAITASQLALVFSGGSGNSDPNASLGGQPSAYPVTSGLLNNLFEDVTSEQTSDGIVEYRCLYVFNDGDQPFYNIKLWIDSQTDGGSDIELGTAEQDEVQRLTIQGTVTGGSITLSFSGQFFTTVYDANLNTWAQNIQASMNGLTAGGEPLLGGVVVSAQTNGTSRFFDISYTNIDGKKDQPLIQVEANNLTPTPTASVGLLLQGSPVNTIAPSIDVSTTPPGGVTFSVPTENEPINILKLNEQEGFPFWVQRTTPAGATPLSRDAFVLKIRIQSINPVV